MMVQDQEVPRNLQLTFFLEELFSWQKWRSKPQHRAISHNTRVVFHVVVLIRPGQNLNGPYNCDRKNRGTSIGSFSVSSFFLARSLRIEYTGTLYDIPSRGNEKTEEAVER
jgi:hypothetical protein